MVQKKSYTFENLPWTRKEVKRPEHCTTVSFFRFHAIKTTNDKPIFLVVFITDIVGAARAPEDQHNFCLSEPLAPIMKFPTRAR